MKRFLILLLGIFMGCMKDEMIAKIPEASGLCYCKNSDTIFVANDEGKIYEIALDGKILREKKLGKYDLEGVACDDKNSNLLFAVEGKESILVVDMQSFKIKREVKIDRKYNGKTVIKKDKEYGIEGITIIDGNIYISNQSYKKYPNKDASIVFKISGVQFKKAKIESVLAHNFVDIAGLSYFDGFLYMVSDKKNLLIQYDIDSKKVVKEIKLPEFAQEGITFDGKGNIYFADDEGRIMKYKMNSLIKD